jgi:hypothetical protein
MTSLLMRIAEIEPTKMDSRSRMSTLTSTILSPLRVEPQDGFATVEVALLAICRLLYHLSTCWRLRQSGTRTLKFLFAGRNSGHFFDPSTANRWNIRQNRSKSPRDSEWARQVDPAGRFLVGNFRVVHQPGTKVTDGSEPLMFPKSIAELSDD